MKIVRAGMARLLPGVRVMFGPVHDAELTGALRAKLIEEAVEYLLDPSLSELADVWEVIGALARHDLGLDMHAVEQQALRKSEERGGFDRPLGMYLVSAQARARSAGARG